MIRTSIENVRNWIGASLYGCGDPSIQIQGVSIDSRQIEMGTLYIPIIGARADGHTFIEQVKQSGAAASLWQSDHKPYPAGIPLILVEDTLSAMHALARAYLQHLDCTVIGITGSNGKTSCKDMMQSVLSTKGKAQCTRGNRNSEYGLPLTIFEFDEEIEFAILEMGLEYPGDLDTLCSIARPEYSVITSVGSAHMEHFQGQAGIAQGKLEIYQGTKPGGHFFYHKDSPYLQQCLEQMPVRQDVTIHSFGTEADLHVVGDIQHSAEGLTFQVNGCKSDFFLPLWGDFQVMNALPVIGIARLLGCSEQQIAQGFRSLKLTGMRANRIQVGPAWILDDTYKSNPESAKAAIDALMSMPAATHIAVLADMLDLGENEWALHEQIGQYAKQKGVDQMICTGPRSKATVQGFGQSALWMETQEEIVQVLKETVQKPCAVLIKGSRALAMDRIVEELRGAQR